MELIRFVRGPQGWAADRSRCKQAGRGAYLCSQACGAAAAKNRRYPGLSAAAAEYGLIRSSTDGC
ncbi:MAG: YlxR family protein [Candidatus Eremiobacteraeota bacterium]|nr:YlxR family protein [Candidatus Eremiobacteraeota bacterium]MBV8373498.1 YlxR family protein [Candidatus Eremiobacteraeota bacterium]